MRFRVVVIAIAVCGLTACPALAQQDRAAAEALFQQGRQQMEAGNYDEACKAFEGSQRLDPADGTLLNLALCYEKAGKLASAWVTYTEAGASAQRAGHEKREEVAKEYAAALQPRLSYLELKVAASPPDLEIKKDGVPIPQAVWGTAMPVDPGEFEISASAPGYESWSQKQQIEGESQRVSVSVPELKKLPQAPAAAEPSPEPVASNQPSTQATADLTQDVVPSGGDRTWAWVSWGVGLVGIGVGTYFGLDASSKWDDAQTHCDATSCTQQGVDLTQDAGQSADISTVAFGVGLAGAALGTVLWFTLGDDSEQVAFGTEFTTDRAGLKVRGTF